jgi:hypothetical protein
MRMRFDQLFSVQNGTVTPKTVVAIGGVTMSPGVSFGSGVSFSGVDLTQHIGKDVEAELVNGVYVISGFYN